MESAEIWNGTMASGAVIGWAFGWALGWAFGWRSCAKNAQSTMTRILNTQAIDRANFLQTLRRELANILVWRNPRRYLQLYCQLHSEVTSIGLWRHEEVHKHLVELCEKYPYFSDFNARKEFEYILYSDDPSIFSNLEQRYRDLVIFAALSAIGDDSWKNAAGKGFVHTTSDRELLHLTEYARQVEDTKFRLRIDRAMEFYNARHDGGIKEKEISNDLYSIRRLPHFAEIRYGIHLKQTNEFAIYSFFVHDSGDISRSFYRSDPIFEDEQFITPLDEVLREWDSIYRLG